VRVLGEGGMGTVWLAEHRTLSAEVAARHVAAGRARWLRGIANPPPCRR
jgi:serine/threonine protein kinase